MMYSELVIELCRTHSVSIHFNHFVGSIEVFYCSEHITNIMHHFIPMLELSKQQLSTSQLSAKIDLIVFI